MFAPTPHPVAGKYDTGAVAAQIAAEDQPHLRNEALRAVPRVHQKVVNMLVDQRLRKRMRDARGF